MHNSDFWTRNTSFYGYQTSPVVLYMQIIVISTRITSLYGFQPSSVVLRIQKSNPFESGEHFWMQKSGFWTWIRSLYGSLTWSVVLCMQNSVISTGITSLCGTQLIISGFCRQNSDFWTRITSVYGSQTSPVVLCMQNSVISTESLVSITPSPHLWLCAFKTATLALEWLVYMVSSPRAFVHAKQRL